MSDNEVIANPIAIGSVVRVRAVAILQAKCPIQVGDVGVVIKKVVDAGSAPFYEIRTLHRPYEPNRWLWFGFELEVLQEPET